MATFKTVATYQLLLLCMAFAIGSFHRGSSLYPLFLAIVAPAAVFLILVLMLASRAVAASLPPGADAVARAAADGIGIASIAARWKRASLRGMLLLAVGLSAAAFFLAAVIFEDGNGMSAAARWALVAGVMLFMAPVHGFFAWAAVQCATTRPSAS